jgi:5-methylthioadenosine/S-adenosylhomocysteine deaminase
MNQDLKDRKATMSDSFILHGGTVVGMADGQPRSHATDILVIDGVIAAITPNLAADGPAGLPRIDVSGQLVLPGFVDTHRHSWQTGIRGVAADWSLLEYVRNIRMGYARAYRPEDVYMSVLIGVLEAVDAGITTMCDFCHIMNSPAHADAALDAFADSGIRGVLSYGFYDVPLSEPVFRSHEERLSDVARFARRFEERPRGPMRLGVALTEAGLVTAEQTQAEIMTARHLGLRITAHMGTLSTPDAIGRLHAAQLLGPDILHVHCNFSSDDELAYVRDSGGAVSITPETELQMGMGFPVTGRLLRLGMRPSLGIDIVSDYSGDMFSQMRMALQVERALLNEPTLRERKMPATISPSVLDALRFATVDGARALGLQDKVGHLAVGMCADVVTLRTDGLHYMPAAEPVASIVLQARPSDVSNVIVAGRFLKKDGVLLGHDLASLRARMAASGAFLQNAVATQSQVNTETTSAYSRAISNIVDL